MYSAGPRYHASSKATTIQAFATKEVFLSADVFNTPQILELSGIGLTAELAKFKIPLIVDPPGVGQHLQDNIRNLISYASKNFTNIAPTCTFGAPGDPCLAAWELGKGPYATGPLDSVMFKSSGAVYGERDVFMWGAPGSYRGYWPAQTVNAVPFDPPNSWGF